MYLKYFNALIQALKVFCYKLHVIVFGQTKYN